MNTLEFLRAVLAGEGFYCALGLMKDASPIQKFYPDIESLANAATQLMDNKRDAFFGLATYKTGGSRKAPNAYLIKSFFLDLDCGVGVRKFATQTEAVSTLKDFCKTIGLPRPMLVKSGRGVHVYWPLKEAVPVADWLPVATAFKKLTTQHLIGSDNSVPADVVRVLRVPYTLHFKDEPPKLVEIVNEVTNYLTLEEFKAIVGVSNIFPVGPRQYDAVTESLAGNTTGNFKDLLVKTSKGIGCQQIGHIATNQEEISYGLWRCGLSVANFCEDRDKAIHLISKKHPSYSADITEKKASDTIKPFKCATFESENPGGCDGCVHKGKINSPWKLCMKVIEATEEDNEVISAPAEVPQAPVQTYTIPKYPFPYLRGQNGGVYKRIKDEDADKDIVVYHNDIYVVKRIVDPDGGEAAVVRLHMPRDGVREFNIPLTAIGSKEEFRKCVAMHGVTLINVTELMYYISTWVNHLQMNTKASIAKKQFGWVGDEFTMDSFVVGEREIFADRIEPNPATKNTKKYFPMFRPRGDLAKWIETVNFFNKPNMELLQFCIGMGFGSPLMQITAVNGARLHIWSKETGIGKSTGMYVAASIWGNPMEITTTERDTHNFRMNRAEVYKNIFMPMDELTNSKGEELSKAAYAYSEGHKVGGMERNGVSERTRGEAWKQLCISTGNTSLIEAMKQYRLVPKAEAARVLEFFVSESILPAKEVTDELSANIKTCYGVACDPYIQYVIKNKEEVIKLFNKTRATLDEAIGLTAKHRFYSALVATTMTGLIIAKRLGLISFSLSALVKWLIATMKTKIVDLAELDTGPETIIQNFIAENYNNILRIKSTDRSKEADDDVLVIPDSTPRISFVARYEYDVKQMFIMLKPLKDWCTKLKIDPNLLIKDLAVSNLKGKTVNKRMGKGTRLNLTTEYVLQLDYTAMDNETENAIKDAASRVSTEVTA